MRKTVCYSFLSALLAFYSCGNKPQYNISPVTETSFADQDRVMIEPTKLDYCPMGVSDIMSYDKYLFFITMDNDAYLKVYDIEKGSQVAALCHQGRAGNEFSFPLFFTAEQAYTASGEIMLPIMDITGALSEINITRSIDEQRTVINRAAASVISSTSSHLAFVDDDFSKMFVSDLKLSSTEPAQPVRFYIQDSDGEKTEIPVFKDVMPGDYEFGKSNYYSGVLMKHPGKNIMVYSMAHLDYLIFFDLDNSKTFTIHQNGTDTFEKYVTENPDLLHLGDATASDEYYFTFYLANCRNNPDADYVCEVLAFDWDGNYAGGFKTNTAIHRISYNEKTQSLYCANIGEELLYVIPVKDFLKSL